ncbi:MAG: hypothetical protein K8J09_00140 [Planctomycetes bacterium]|nr:hypothetical protein [Planctomycetota bacterium]MCC7399445.1 hypothetical protein [Planctomycetota bacterium]
MPDGFAGVIDARAALGWHEGHLLGSGRDYKVEFTADGFLFTPAFGPAAPHNLPVAWHTETVRRGDAVWELSPVAPVWRGERVEYARGAVMERCQVQVNLLHQDFVFTALPAGGGDLVVRGAVTTELQGEVVGRDELRFRAPGIGSFPLAGIVGIDARGHRCAGQVRFVGGGSAIEFVLPAAFVDGARLPLVLDPNWGGPVTIETSTAIDHRPDIAQVATGARRYLVAWEHAFSATDYDIYGQYLDAQTALLGPKEFLAATGANEQRVCLAEGPVDQFVFAYQQGPAIVARTSIGGVLGALLTVAASGSSPDLGGHVTTSHQRTLCVWDNGPSIDASVLAVNGGVLSVFAGPSTLFVGTTSAPFQVPAVSKTSGLGNDGLGTETHAESQSRWAVVAHRDWSTDSDLHLRIVDWNGFVIGSAALDTSLEDHDFADVDGNGRDWLVAWQRRVGSERDVVCRQVTLPIGGTVVTTNGATPTVVAGAAGLIELAPSVRCMGAACLIGYQKEATVGQYQPRLTTRSLIGCEVCAGDEALPGVVTATTVGSPLAMATRGLVEPYEARRYVVYEYPNPAHAGNGQILGYWTDVADGRLVDRGGNCGSYAGTLLTNCAVNGPPSLRVLLRDSLPNANAWLVLSPSTLAIGCGGCLLSPDPFSGLVLGTSTDALGAAQIVLPPVGVGALWNVSIHLQWFVANPSSPACTTFGVDLSSAKTLTPQ